MKMTRTQLKALVKECLVEILAEGLGSDISEAVTAPRQASPSGRRGGGSMMHTNGARMPTPAVKEAVKEMAAGNSIMESLLADTAKNTLPEFMEQNRQMSGGGGMGTMHTPEEFVNEEMASKWMEVLSRTSVG